MGKRYTVTQAVLDAIESFPWNVKFHCNEFFSKCRFNLLKNGSVAHPYDGTLQRIMRSYRHVYNIVCIDRAKSIYMKKDENAE